jgi:hypothetical protein
MQTRTAEMWRVGAMLLMAGSFAACMVDKQEAPAVSGPSTSAFSLTLTPMAERLPRDGATQTIVTLSARDEISSTVLPAQRVALSSVPFEATLSTAEVTTGTDGRAMFSVTAPPATAPDEQIVIFATPVGGASDRLAPRQVAIPLIETQGIVARFTVNPAQPRVGQTVTFDASGSTVEPGAVITNYSWSYGDGGSEATNQATRNHVYSESKTYAVILTITDNRGRTSSTAKNILVVP